jgi:hypothetical protein
MASAHEKLATVREGRKNDARGGPTINDLEGVGIFTSPENGSRRERSDFFIHNY